jgi:pimeloyl-ACP methyl ester carboxylesterase
MTFIETPGGVRLRYCDRGEGDPAIVLVHGWKGSHRLWDPVIHRLARSTRVIAFDNRGMGESDKPGGDYDIPVLAEDLAHVLTSADVEDVTLVGWSMGCSICLEYLAAGGDRAGRLVLVNGPIKLESDEDFALGLKPGQLRSSIDELARGWPGSERDFARGAVLDPSGDFAELYYRVALQTPLADSIKIAEEQAKLDHRDLLSRLQLPVLAIFGARDSYYPTELAEYIARRAPLGRHLIFADSAHAAHYDEPERFCEAILEFGLTEAAQAPQKQALRDESESR